MDTNEIEINILIKIFCLSHNDVKSSKGKTIIFNINPVKWKKVISIKINAKKGIVNTKNNKKYNELKLNKKSQKNENYNLINKNSKKLTIIISNLLHFFVALDKLYIIKIT